MRALVAWSLEEMTVCRVGGEGGGGGGDGGGYATLYICPAVSAELKSWMSSCRGGAGAQMHVSSLEYNY